MVDTSRLGGNRPWYSGAYNDMIEPGKTSPYGFGLQSMALGQHVLGQKQYELSNHLGNVQATISDERYVQSTGGGLKFKNSIVAAYDYYPFGMLMPGRFVSDTGQRSAVITQSVLMPRVVSTTVPLTGAVASGPEITLVPDFGGGTLFANGTGGGALLTIPVQAQIPVSIRIALSHVRGYTVIYASEFVNGSWQVRASQPMNYSGYVPALNFTPTTSQVRLYIGTDMMYISSAQLFWILDVSVERMSLVPELMATTIHNTDKDRYSFGFNGMLKHNEVAGTANHLDYGARGYDPRRAGWWSIDPHSKNYPSISPYSFALNSPIMYNDPDGKDVEVAIIRNLQGGGGTIKLSSMVYVTGANAAAIVAKSQEAFKEWKNKSGTTSDGKWQVEIQMTFKVATAEDVDRIKNANAEQAGENLLNANLPAGGRAYSNIQGHKYSSSRAGKFQGAGNQARINSSDGGHTAIHENLHLYGLGDRYSEVTYEMNVNGQDIGRSGVMSKMHVGFENDIMNAGWELNQEHVDNFASKVLNISTEKGDNFITGRVVDDAGAAKDGNNVDRVPQTFKSGNVEYSNPKPPNTKK